MTERSRVVLDLSLREALSLGHNYIGTEHILLALVREEEGVAGRLLESLGLDRQKVRDEVLRVVGSGVPNECPTCGGLRKREA